MSRTPNSTSTKTSLIFRPVMRLTESGHPALLRHLANFRERDWAIELANLAEQRLRGGSPLESISVGAQSVPSGKEDAPASTVTQGADKAIEAPFKSLPRQKAVSAFQRLPQGGNAAS